MDDNKMIAGFVKGTMVRVDSSDFWKPIEEIQVGDMVLSIPENGIGEPVFKRVVNTFKFENKEIWYVGAYDLDEDPKYIKEGQVYFLSRYYGTTANHPFLVVGTAYHEEIIDTETPLGIIKGSSIGTPETFVEYDKPEWKRADELKFNDVLFNPKTGKKYCVALSRPMYKHIKGENFAWINARPHYSHSSNYDPDYEAELGTLYNMENIGSSGEFELEDISCLNIEKMLTDNYRDSYERYTDTVYNFEVEDYHTYMVGTGNIVVHNSKNIGKI